MEVAFLHDKEQIENFSAHIEEENQEFKEKVIQKVIEIKLCDQKSMQENLEELKTSENTQLQVLSDTFHHESEREEKALEKLRIEEEKLDRVSVL